MNTKKTTGTRPKPKRKPGKVLPFAESSEPEDLIGQALYLLQLCQQDLNMERKSTIWPRVKRAREACQALEAMFAP